MFGFVETWLIQFPSKRWGYVGSIPATLGAEVPAQTSDVLGGRAYRKESGELVTVKFPAFDTREQAIRHAADHDVTVREA